jgi:hypothetical protein
VHRRCASEQHPVPQELRLDAAAKAARFERPTLAAVAVQQTPRAHIDLSVLTPEEQKVMAEMLIKVMRPSRPPAIDGVALRE